jgi:hypothetical protein
MNRGKVAVIGAGMVGSPPCSRTAVGRPQEEPRNRLWCKFLNWLVYRYVQINFHAASTALHMAGGDLV